MNINIDNEYKLTSDSRSVILVKTWIGQEGKSKGVEQEANVGYYANVQAALKDYLRIKTNLSNATTIKELLADVKKIEKTIEEVLKGV